MFDKILIANRGEIACRVAATARRLGVRTVAVYSDADRQAKHVRACDEAVHIGGAAAHDSYLRADRLIQAALDRGAQAIHPGYGFLSENEDFARACVEARLVFIGPPARAIQSMGLKSQAKQLMERAGVPLVPGYHGADQDPQVLRRAADRIGYPVMIKASAGGGGKGMRVVERAEDFDAALVSCQREAAHSFANDAVLIERYLTRPRHIEIQIFADTLGHCIYLFERDCSVQRRHQKVLEEAPAPGLTPARRQDMGAAAVAAATAVGYVGAGTVEFIAEPRADGGLEFYFMEMNTRLQVEHPVTEAITGLDLVEWQLRIASGQALPLQQHEVTMQGHAIEARICAENPQAQFLPATGRLSVLRAPAQSVCFERGAVRFDSGVDQGDSISPFYDSMIAKLIVWGVDREQALRRMRVALSQTHVVGLHNNVDFLGRVVASRAFAGADLDTALIERERAALFDAVPLPMAWTAAAVAAHLVAAAVSRQTDDPWSHPHGWRLHGHALRCFDLVAGSARGTVTLKVGAQAMTLGVHDRDWAFSCASLGQGDFDIALDGRRARVSVYAAANQYSVFTEDGHAIVHLVDPLDQSGGAAAPSGGLCAPMPGKVVAFLAQAGDSVAAGQPLAVMEAMKMEHTIAAPHDGRIEALLFAVGDQVDEGSALLRMARAV